MSVCQPGRIVKLRLKWKQSKQTRDVYVVYPERWQRKQVLDRCREQHPNETVKILAWGVKDISDKSVWEPLWVSGAFLEWEQRYA